MRLRGFLAAVLISSSPTSGCPAFRAGGDDGIRTHDPLLAGQVLSQLSYTPLLGVLATSSVTEN